MILIPRDRTGCRAFWLRGEVDRHLDISCFIHDHDRTAKHGSRNRQLPVFTLSKARIGEFINLLQGFHNFLINA